MNTGVAAARQCSHPLGCFRAGNQLCDRCVKHYYCDTAHACQVCARCYHHCRCPAGTWTNETIIPLNAPHV